MPKRERISLNEIAGPECELFNQGGNVLTPLFCPLGLESEGGSKWGQRREANPYPFHNSSDNQPQAFAGGGGRELLP